MYRRVFEIIQFFQTVVKKELDASQFERTSEKLRRIEFIISTLSKIHSHPSSDMILKKKSTGQLTTRENSS